LRACTDDLPQTYQIVINAPIEREAMKYECDFFLEDLKKYISSKQSSHSPLEQIRSINLSMYMKTILDPDVKFLYVSETKPFLPNFFSCQRYFLKSNIFMLKLNEVTAQNDQLEGVFLAGNCFITSKGANVYEIGSSEDNEETFRVQKVWSHDVSISSIYSYFRKKVIHLKTGINYNF
jgi:hypothetical protein